MSTSDVELPDAPINGPTSSTPIRNGGTNRSGGVTITEPPAAADSPALADTPAPVVPADPGQTPAT